MLRKRVLKIWFRICRFSIRKHEKLLKWYYFEKLIKEGINVVGDGVVINGRINVIYPKGFIIGNNVHIGKGAHVDARGGVVIGDHVHISRNVTIYSTNHNYEGELIPYDETLIPNSVIIEEGVWIGMNVCITPGVSIGKGAIIGMGSVVSKDVRDGEIVVSNTQRVIGSRDLDSFYEKKDNLLVGGVSGRKLDMNLNFKLPLLPTLHDGGGNIVFVLSTGRSGSNALAKIMEQDENIVTYHEPLYVLLKTICTKYLCGKISKDEVKKQMVRFYNTVPLLYRGKIYLESDQKIVPFIDILIELFPNAKFIWVIRDPYKFALSATSRGWFSKEDKVIFVKEKPILDTRVSSEGQRNFLDYLDEYQTDDFSPFEKNVLYWKIWNRMIYNEFLKIDQKNRLFVKLESIEPMVSEIHRFIGGKQSIKIKTKKTNKVKKKDKVKYEQNKKKLDDLIASCRVEVSEEQQLWNNI